MYPFDAKLHSNRLPPNKGASRKETHCSAASVHEINHFRSFKDRRGSALVSSSSSNQLRIAVSRVSRALGRSGGTPSLRRIPFRRFSPGVYSESLAKVHASNIRVDKNHTRRPTFIAQNQNRETSRRGRVRKKTASSGLTLAIFRG
jgi:hypothetical protein